MCVGGTILLLLHEITNIKKGYWWTLMEFWCRIFSFASNTLYISCHEAITHLQIKPRIVTCKVVLDHWTIHMVVLTLPSITTWFAWNACRLKSWNHDFWSNLLRKKNVHTFQQEILFQKNVYCGVFPSQSCSIEHFDTRVSPLCKERERNVTSQTVNYLKTVLWYLKNAPWLISRRKSVAKSCILFKKWSFFCNLISCLLST